MAFWSARKTVRQSPARLTFLLRSSNRTVSSAAIWLSAVGFLALALMAACGSGGAQTPLPGAVKDCHQAAQYLGRAQLIDCEEEKGVALVHLELTYGPRGWEEVDQYFLTPLRVASLNDFRAKRDWAWEHWDVWEREDIDICEVKLGHIPDSLTPQLSPTDFKPAECR